jgi:hypothetical protein
MFKSPEQVSPDQVGVVPPSPAEGSVSPPPPKGDQVGDVWTRGYANLLKGTSDMFHLLDAWSRDLSAATGLDRGGIFENVERWMGDKAEEEYLTAAPATGKYARPPENLLGYLDPARMYKVAGENVPLMGAFIASLLIHKGAGSALMFGVEGGSARQTLDEYEAAGGQVEPIVKQSVPVVVGAVNAALERTGISSVLRTAGLRGLKAKITNIAVSSMVEGTTEGAQEIMQALGEATYKGEIPADTGARFIESLYAGLVLGLGGSSVAGAFGEVGEAPPGKPEEVAPETVPEGEIDTTPLTGFELLDMTPAQAVNTIKDLPDDQLPIVRAEIERLEKQIDPFRNELFTEQEIADLDAFKGSIIEARNRGETNYTDEDVDALGSIAMSIAKYSGMPLSQLIEEVKFTPEPGRRTFGVRKIKGMEGQYEYYYLHPAAKLYGLKDREHVLNFGRPEDILKESHTIDDELLKAMEEGKEKFEVEEIAFTSILGTTTVNDKMNLILALFKRGDQHTFAHELGHVLHYVMKPEDFKVVEDWLGVPAKEQADPEQNPKWRTQIVWGRERAEQFADGFGKYLATNKAPTGTLQKVFDKVKEWFVAVHRKLRLSGIKLSPEINKFFDKVLKSGALAKEHTVDITEWEKQKDTLLAGLSSRMNRAVTHTLAKGFDVTNMDEATQERIFEIVHGMSATNALNWAKSQIDADEWIAFFKGEGTPPVVLEHNAGTDDQNEMHGEPPPPPEQPDPQTEDVQYRKPKHIPWLLQRILTPEFLLKGRKRPAEDASKVIRGELLLNHKMRDYETWYKKLKHKLSKKERLQVRKAMELMYRIKGENVPVATIVRAEGELADLYAKYPRLQKVMKGVDERGGILALFEYVKERYQNSLREQKRLKLTPVDNNIVDDIIKESRRPFGERGDTRALAQTLVEDRMDIESIARQEVDKKNGSGTWLTMPQAKKNKKRQRVIRREANRLLKESEEITSIDDWGLRDYITNIELGSYRVLDDSGRTLGFGRTAREAKKKAFQIRQEKKDAGEEAPRLRVEASFSPINPTEKRHDVLAGEVDIFEVLPRYIYAMEKRTVMQPIVEQYKQNVKNFPSEYTGDVRNIIQTQIDYVLGARYSFGDMIADDVATAYGWETGKYSRAVGKIRKYTANLKLGYRPVAAFVNAMGGFGNTWVGVGNRFFVKGRDVLMKGTYTAPDGSVVDMKAKLKGIEDESGLGMDFAVGESGEISTRMQWWKPLRLFQLPEQFIRPHSFASNYVYQREALGKNDSEATEAALQNLRFQNFAYNLSAIPHILRSPAGRTIGQFKTYLVNELQFISTLRGRQIARMAGLQLMMAGPRGAIYLLKSIPFLGALGLLDDAEEWLVRKKGPVADLATRGVAGLFGADISAPATFQLPSRPEDWGGPFLGDAVGFYKEVILPSLQTAASKVSGRPAPAYVGEGFVNWLAALSPLLYYLKDFESSVMFWDEAKAGEFEKAWANVTENIQKPNVWIRDSAGNKAYKIGGLQDRILLLMGAAPTNKSQYQVLRDIWRKDREIMRDNRRKWYDKVTRKLQRGLEVGADLWHDAILYRVDPSQIPEAYKFKEMTPQQRETLRANLFERAEAFEHFGVE